jgi:hypothetical protein
MEYLLTNFVDTKEIAKSLVSAGHSSTHLLRNIRNAGYDLHKIRRPNGRPGRALTKQDAEKFLASYQTIFGAERNSSTSDSLDSIEDRIRQQRENEGWISFRLASAGMPDLINLKPHGNGLFEVLFEEVKGPGDSLRKEQHVTLEGMKEKGIPSIITWL